ncbi:MAG: MarC family protein [Saprospiraceae bacterium]|nr:MarC family protein [Saprospiraceae bacterium]
MLDFDHILSVTLILFSVIDVPGNIPVVLSLKEQGRKIEPGKATLVAGVLMILFLFFGKTMLGFFGVDVSSFAIAGSILIFVIGAEMILNVRIIREEQGSDSTTVFPIAFPLIAGAGTLTTILTLRAEYSAMNIAVGIAINLVFVWLMLKFSGAIRRAIGPGGVVILRKIFGIILLAIAVKIFKANWGI